MSKANHHGSQDGSAHAALTWWISGLVCVALFGAIFWFVGPGRSAPSPSQGAHTEGPSIPVPEGMTWPALTIDTNQLDKARATHTPSLPKARLELEEVKALHEVVQQINDHQFVTHPIPSKTPQHLEQALKITLSNILTEFDETQFLALGEPIFAQCATGFEQLQKDLEQGKLTLEQATADADFETYTVYRKFCGNMLGELHNRGLLDEKGQWRSVRAKKIGSILERYRWAHMFRLYADPITQLAPIEREILTRWRVEDPQAFKLDTRERFIDALHHHVPHYPEGVAEAMIAYERGNKQDAAEILSRYRNQSPNNPTYKVMYEALTQELESK